MLTQPYTVVDAFADRPFAGNPAAVVVLDGPPDEGWMRLVAREFNLSETAFTYPEGSAWRLRWLTPTVEVDACGHATVATTRVLLDAGRARDMVEFETRSGRLTCWEDGEQIAMDWPADPCDRPVNHGPLAGALGVPVRAAGGGRQFILAEVADAQTVRMLDPDPSAVAALGSTGLIVTAAGDGDDIQVVSRVFAPQAGIPEDPVTGSAHCSLGPWWVERMGQRFSAQQVSARGGRVDVRMVDDRVQLRGHAVTVAAGHLRAAA